MQGRLDRHVAGSRQLLLALSILTFGVAMLAVQVRSTVAASATSFKVDKLIGSKGSGGKKKDSHMINPWGTTFIAAAATPFWINDEGTGVSELIDGKGKIMKALPFVTIPGATAGSVGKPAGIVGNATGQFAVPGSTSALFIFATENGTIAGWNESLGATATTIITNSSEVYTGLALANNGTANLLYAANSKGSIDVFDSNFNPTTTTGGFSDPDLPTGFTPYNITAIGSDVFVAYSMGVQAVGQVDEFDTEGNLIMSFRDPSLNSPWGLTLAPSHFGTFSNDLLVGNKGDGTISVFNPANGEFLGQLEDHDGKPIVIQDLWSLVDGMGAMNATADAVYFTAGTGGYAEGVFGTIEAGPSVKQTKTKGTSMPGMPYMPSMPMM
ncbi:TIGR03118 family protein [Candidatus Binatus sp.]|uniref:TIGR03118 family protein n=1 Tax=Candidatus Binatus sp. TaxID=2811406 RepID=UPI003BB0DE30